MPPRRRLRKLQFLETLALKLPLLRKSIRRRDARLRQLAHETAETAGGEQNPTRFPADGHVKRNPKDRPVSRDETRALSLCQTSSRAFSMVGQLSVSTSNFQGP